MNLAEKVNLWRRCTIVLECIHEVEPQSAIIIKLWLHLVTSCWCGCRRRLVLAFWFCLDFHTLVLEPVTQLDWVTGDRLFLHEVAESWSLDLDLPCWLLYSWSVYLHWLGLHTWFCLDGLTCRSFYGFTFALGCLCPTFDRSGLGCCLLLPSDLVSLSFELFARLLALPDLTTRVIVAHLALADNKFFATLLDNLSILFLGDFLENRRSCLWLVLVCTLGAFPCSLHLGKCLFDAFTSHLVRGHPAEGCCPE